MNVNEDMDAIDNPYSSSIEDNPQQEHPYDTINDGFNALGPEDDIT